MRLTRLSFGVLAVFLCVATVPGMATPPAPPEKTAEASPAAKIRSTKITITPHRAIYDMRLASVKNGSNISGVSGKMLFEWRDVCDGWAIQQHMNLHFTYAEGDESDVASAELTWESKDGKSYTFNIRRTTDGKETERYVGKASMTANGGTVTYSAPEKKEMSLPPGTLFPTAHTELILSNAMAGNKLFERRVFDGSDEDGSNDVSVFINPEEAHWQDANLGPKLKNNPLLAQPEWPVRLAFFKLDTETGEPDYEMNLNLLSNGVAQRMLIDYGDFSVIGTLSEIESMPPAGCS